MTANPRSALEGEKEEGLEKFPTPAWRVGVLVAGGTAVLLLMGWLTLQPVWVQGGTRVSIPPYPSQKESVKPLYGNLIVGQSFVAERGNLSQIEVALANFASRPAAGLVTLHLKRDPADPEDLRQASLEAAQVGPQSRYHAFSFPLVPDSENQSFYFYVQYPEGSAERPLAVRYEIEGQTYREGVMHLAGHVPKYGDVAFALSYRMSGVQMVSHWFSGHPGGLPLYGTLALGGLLLGWPYRPFFTLWLTLLFVVLFLFY